jgi:hypothetical protein
VTVTAADTVSAVSSSGSGSIRINPPAGWTGSAVYFHYQTFTATLTGASSNEVRWTLALISSNLPPGVSVNYDMKILWSTDPTGATIQISAPAARFTGVYRLTAYAKANPAIKASIDIAVNFDFPE